ncbi:MAG TPA: Coenzyme F420 hydrogenase/dehydrogenase, beta subunit C-terminal domain [Smithella sp.]|nr:Coenzyme F420 hydrogenase/dehydrogenase, beta subunit C-terminal domain [Smithella sp.]
MMSFRHVERKKCIGCGLCYSVCKFEAVEMTTDEFSYVPRLIEENCTDCGECLEVCPEINVLDYPDKFGSIMKYLICNAKDQKIRHAASSGGACRAILASLLDKGVVNKVIITRATDDPYKSETIVTGNISDLMSDRLNSIYSPTSPLSALKSLDEGLKYAFVGLPCHIAGLKLCPELKKNIFVTIGIFCTLTPSFKFIDTFADDLSKNGEVTGLRYRGDGWPGKTVAYHQNGGQSEFNFVDMWHKYNYDRKFQLSRCGECTYYSSEFADISIGDAWHMLGRDQEGSSLVLVRSKKGADVIDASESWIDIKTIDNPDEAMQFHDFNSQIKQGNKAKIKLAST